MDLQGALDTASVVDEAHFPEAVHEEAHPGTRGADHFGQSFLADFGDHGFRNPLFAETSKQEQNRLISVPAECRSVPGRQYTFYFIG